MGWTVITDTITTIVLLFFSFFQLSDRTEYFTLFLGNNTDQKPYLLSKTA